MAPGKKKSTTQRPLLHLTQPILSPLVYNPPMPPLVYKHDGRWRTLAQYDLETGSNRYNRHKPRERSYIAHECGDNPASIRVCLNCPLNDCRPVWGPAGCPGKEKS